MQPGEVAPFEIQNWDRTDDPAQSDLTVDALMSPKADISRSYWWTNWNPRPPLSIAEAEQLERDQGYEPGIVRLIADRLGGVRWTGSTALFRVPVSHPSFANHIGDNPQLFETSDLTGYLAYLSYIRDEHRYEVFEVIELSVASTPGDMDSGAVWFASDRVSELAWIGLPNPQIRQMR